MANRKRSNGYRNIHRQKTGKWRGEYFYYVGDEQRTRTFTNKTKGEVERRIDSFESLLTESNTLPGTVGAYLEEWWRDVKGGYRPSTRDLYESTLRTHIKGTVLAKHTLFDFTPAEVAKHFGTLREAGVSENTLHRVYKLLHAAFEVGVGLRKLKFNPIDLPKIHRPQKLATNDVRAFTPEEELKLIRYVMGTEWETLVLVALDSGCRQQELLGLQKPNVNLAKSEIRIRQTLNTVKGGPVLENMTKTARAREDASRRDLTLAASTVASLKRHLAKTMAVPGYVFTTPMGKPWNRSDFSKAWTKILKAAGLPHAGFHTTRHTCATRLLREGAFIVAVSKRLGHAKPSITLDLYSHAIPADQAALTDRFQALLDRSEAAS